MSELENTVCDFASEIERAACLNERQEIFRRALASLGIERFAYVNTGRKFKRFYIEYTYPPEWVDHYIRNGYHDIDCVAREGQSSVLPFHWQPLLIRPNVGKQARLVFDEASEFGILDGLSIPIHSSDGFAMMSMAVEHPDLFSAAARPLRHSLHMMSLYYHEAVENSVQDSAPLTPLSPREREVLTWAARGKTAGEIADILNLSERTAVFHIENAKKKFGATTRQQAIAAAVVSGQISP